MERVQERFKEMLKDLIAPALRELGFKGSGQRYVYPHERCHVMLGVQKSVSSDARRVKFTINVLVVDKERWTQAVAQAPYLGEVPKPNTYTAVGFHQRIGVLLDQGDVWWTMGPETDPRQLAENLLTNIGDALPLMREMADAPSPPLSPFGKRD